MHSLTKQNGYMFVTQAYINGNDFIILIFLESIAMANNYKILSNFYVIYTNSYQDLILPIDTEIDKIINLTNAKGGIGINYMYRKTTSEEFKFPYQGTGTSIKRDSFYTPIYNFNSSPLSREYIPTEVDNLSGRLMFKLLIKKYFQNLKSNFCVKYINHRMRRFYWFFNC